MLDKRIKSDYYDAVSSRSARFSPGDIVSRRTDGIFRSGFLYARSLFCAFGRCMATNMAAADLMMNQEIRDREVRVIGQTGEQLGVMPTHAAMQLAEEAGLDLVKIVPNAQPPVCKLMDYDKYRYEQSKKERELRKNQKVVSIKEVQLSATIEENDVQTKAKAAQRFLGQGDKVKVSIRFRGRQITHPEVGLAVMQDFANRCADIAVVERKPLIEGRHMIMILAPKTDKPAAKAPAKEPRAANS